MQYFWKKQNILVQNILLLVLTYSIFLVHFSQAIGANGAPSWYKNFPPWWINAKSMPPGYTTNLASVGALHPPNSYDTIQGSRAKAWFLGMQNYAKMHSIVPPANRPPQSVQSLEKMLSPDQLGQSKTDLFAAVSGSSLVPTNRPGINGGILSAHLANSGLAHMDGDGILANPLAVKEATQLHQQVSNHAYVPGTITKEQKQGGLAITAITHTVGSGYHSFKSTNANLMAANPNNNIKSMSSALRGNNNILQKKNGS